MKRLSTVLCAVALLVTARSYAQKPEAAPRDLRRDGAPEISFGNLTPTPEMWFYLQERQRNDDPRAIIRARAEFEATQRQHRIAAMQWFGFSNLRPAVNPMPYYGTYSPTWTSGNYDPHQWSGTGRPTVILTGSGLSY